MEIQQALLTFSILSRIKFKRQETSQTKTHFIKEHFYAKTIKYMPMVMKMIMHIFIILLRKLGKRNDENLYI